MKYLLVFLASLLSVISADSFSASEDECAIWLCLPTGFTVGCSDARKAFIKRITAFPPKSPLPNFLSCLASAPEELQSVGVEISDFSYTQDFAAYIPEREVCTKYKNGFRTTTCVETSLEPEHYIKDTACESGGKHNSIKLPEGCTDTYFYVDVFIDGVATGDTYYWKN